MEAQAAGNHGIAIRGLMRKSPTWASLSGSCKWHTGLAADTNQQHQQPRHDDGGLCDAAAATTNSDGDDSASVVLSASSPPPAVVGVSKKQARANDNDDDDDSCQPSARRRKTLAMARLIDRAEADMARALAVVDLAARLSAADGAHPRLCDAALSLGEAALDGAMRRLRAAQALAMKLQQHQQGQKKQTCGDGGSSSGASASIITCHHDAGDAADDDNNTDSDDDDDALADTGDSGVGATSDSA